jgi:hypothetical protein
MLKKALIILVFITTSSSFAQFYKTYDWTEKPEHHALSADELKASSIGVLKKNVVEYYSSSNSEPQVFETFHTITKVNDEKGIGQHNTVYIPMYNVKNVVDIKARTISSSGKITLLNKDNIKEVNNVDEYGDFKIFAIEGAEKGSEIEVLYTVQLNYDLFGSETLQSSYPIQKAEFLYITEGFNSKIKAYRTDKTFETIQVDGKKAEQLIVKNIPAMVEEEYSTPDANKIGVVYQCYPKGQTITQDMFWNNVVNNVGGQFFPEKANALAVTDVQTILKDKNDATVFEKASHIDNFVKSNFSIVKNNNEELTEINYILKNRSASDYGIMKAYAHYLKAAGIEYEIVITSNRFTYKFDPDFFIPNMLRDFLIYLPTEDKYIAPDRIEYRVGEAPFNILGNYGLFIKESYEYYFTKIIQVDPDYSRVIRVTDISFDDDFESATLKQNQQYTGHWAATHRAILSLSPEQSIKEFKDYLTGSGIEDKVIVSYEDENNDMNQTEYNVPFIVKCTTSSESLIEDAGDSYLFQIGNVIGTQSELYQETERVNPIEMQYPNQYDYTITVEIPEGYTVEGLSSLNINERYVSKSNNEVLAKFESSYELKNDAIIITIQEFYKTHEFELSQYEEFRNVINAASDFNKAAILFKQKS